MEKEQDKGIEKLTCRFRRVSSKIDEFYMIVSKGGVGVEEEVRTCNKNNLRIDDQVSLQSSINTVNVLPLPTF